MSNRLLYLSLWLMLHRLIDLGLNDHPLAEEVREEMELVGYHLLSEEDRDLDEISVLLHAEREAKGGSP